MVIKCIKFIFGNGRILSGFGYIAVGWIVAKKKILGGRISIILGLILLGALYLAGDTWGFLLKFLIAEILLSASCKVTLPQHPIWEHMRYVSEIIYFVIIWKIRRNHSCPYGFLCYKDKFFSQWRHQTENVSEG